MKLSRYIHTFRNNGHIVLFQTRTLAVAEVDDQTLSTLRKLPDPKLQEEFSGELDALAEQGFVLEKDKDETELLSDWFNGINTQAPQYTAMVLTTYACNLNCGYCIEGGNVSAPVSMNHETADLSVDWIVERVQELRRDGLHVVFYGGEPLLNPEALEYIAAELSNRCRFFGIEFSFTIVTNGTILQPERIEGLIPYGLRGIKTTIDGPPEVHNRNRPFTGGRPSLDTIIANLKAVAGLTPIRINTVVTDGNINPALAVPDMLAEHGLLESICDFEIGAATPRLEDGKNPSRPTGCRLQSYIDNQEMLLAVYREFKSRGLRTAPLIGIEACAMVHVDTMSIIDPLGDIYQCPAFLGQKKFSKGNIRNPDTLRIRSDIPMPPEECYECRFAPMCGGGCRFAAWLETGDIHAPHCTREVFEHHLAELVKTDFL